MYQDIWIKGECVKSGYRDCSGRYEIIKDYCSKFPRGFSVLDIGANTCYFGIRLIEDFDCKVMAFEFNSFEKRQEIVYKNHMQRNLMLIKRKLSIDDLRCMSGMVKFDLVLALSVLHHVKSPLAWVEELQKITDNLIIEFAGADSKRVEKGFEPPEGFNLLGFGTSHLNKEIKRPILAYEKA